ncbi:MAG: hypothetical protein ABFR62_04990 [Bacteroidota bacterium]
MNGRNTGNGQGRGFGHGQGRGQGSGGGRGHSGSGRGRGYGSDSYCECAKCGAKIPHEQGVKCTEFKCPECGNTMVNEALLDKKK